MDFKLLKTFITLASVKNFSLAARKLNTVQPAVSRHIAELEDEIGYSLFWRNTREVKITAAGKCLLKYANELLQLKETALTETIKTGAGYLGQIRIGNIGSASFTFLPLIIRKFKKMYPDVEIMLYEMSVQEQLDAFKSDKIDIGISRKLPQHLKHELNTHKLYQDQLYIVIPDDDKYKKPKVDLFDLQHENFIIFNRLEAPVLFDLVIEECNKHNFTPHIINQPTSMQTVISEVASSLGVSIVPGCIRRLYTKGCKFFCINNDSVIDTEIHYANTNLSPVVELFVNHMVNSAELIKDSVTIT